MTRGRTLLTQYGSVYLFYFILACIMTWPLITHLDNSLAGGFLTDAYQISRHSWSIKHSLQNGTSPFDQYLMAYPDGMSGALIWANPFQFFPVWFFDIFLPLPLAYNLTLLLRLALNGWAMFFLVRYLTKGNVYASLLAGTIFLTYPAVQGRIYGGHLGVLFLWPMPLYLYSIYKIGESSRRLYIGLGVLFCLIAPLGNTSMFIFYVLPIVAMLHLYQLFTRQWLWFRRSLITTALGLLGALIFLGPLMLENANNPQFNTDIGGIVRYSADILSLVTPSFEHPVYGNMQYTHEVLGISLVEGMAYVGIIPLLLAIWSVFRQPVSRWLLFLLLAAWILSLGPLLKYQNELITVHFTSLEGETWESYVSLPLAWIQNLPILSQARTPGRFSFVIGFSIAVLAGYGLADVLKRWQALLPRLLLTNILVVGVVVDYQSFWQMPYVDGTYPAGITDLQDDEDIRSVFNVPWDNPILTKIGMYYQTAHEKPIVTGQFVRDTPVSHAKLTILQNTLDPVLLQANGVDIVIIHIPTTQTAHYEQAVNQFGEPRYKDYRVAIFDVPHVLDPTPEFMSVPPTNTVLERDLTTYIYAPSAGWAVFSGQLAGDTGGVEREIVLSLEDEPFQTWTIKDDVDLNMEVPLYFPERGFYEVELALEPECPHLTNSTVQCRHLDALDLQVDQFSLRSVRDDAVEFDRGLSLRYEFLEGDDETVPQVWLWWQFDEELTDQDVRFVHIVDEQGGLVDQFDDVLPIDYAEVNQWGEILSLDFVEAASPGTYTIYAGWYTYNPPNFDRFRILSNGNYQDNLIEIGKFTIEE